MSATAKTETLRLGFLTAIEVPEKGFIGGLLVTNHYGRPLEFQCTVPVRPNATQEILYGPTLSSFVLGELIGGTLVEKAGVKPHVVLTDTETILELRNHIDQPVALVESGKTEVANEVGAGEMKLGRQIIRLHAAHADDQSMIEKDAKHIPADADLGEPFERVREALNEVLKNGALR